MPSSPKLRHARELAQAQWQGFMSSASTNHPLHWLDQSWRISADSVLATQTCAPVSDVDHTHHRFVQSPWYQSCRPILDELQHTLSESNFVIGLSDEYATLQWTASNRIMAKRLEQTHFIPSARWDELSVGTNAVGIAARTARAACVFSAQHYIPSLHEWVCYAAPIRHPVSGQLMGVLDISAPWQSATPLAQTTVTHYAQAIANAWGAQSNGKASPCLLQVCAAQAGLYLNRVTLPKRLQEIFVVLSLHPTGLSLEALHAHVYGDAPVSLSTLKSEMSHLRQHIGDVLQARPYRLCLPKSNPPIAFTDIDLIEQCAMHHQGHSHAAQDMMQLYQRPLMPQSNAPAIIEHRDYLHQLVIRALLKSKDTEALWQFTQRHSAEYDILSLLAQQLSPHDGRQNAVLAKLAAMDE